VHTPMGGSSHGRATASTGCESIPGLLSKAWAELRVSCRAPERRRPWDAILLTAASSSQAALYTQVLECRNTAASCLLSAYPLHSCILVGELRGIRSYDAAQVQSRVEAVARLLSHASAIITHSLTHSLCCVLPSTSIAPPLSCLLFLLAASWKLPSSTSTSRSRL